MEKFESVHLPLKSLVNCLSVYAKSSEDLPHVIGDPGFHRRRNSQRGTKGLNFHGHDPGMSGRWRFRVVGYFGGSALNVCG